MENELIGLERLELDSEAIELSEDVIEGIKLELASKLKFDSDVIEELIVDEIESEELVSRADIAELIVDVT